MIIEAYLKGYMSKEANFTQGYTFPGAGRVPNTEDTKSSFRNASIASPAKSNIPNLNRNSAGVFNPKNLIQRTNNFKNPVNHGATLVNNKAKPLGTNGFHKVKGTFFGNSGKFTKDREKFLDATGKASPKLNAYKTLGVTL